MDIDSIPEIQVANKFGNLGAYPTNDCFNFYYFCSLIRSIVFADALFGAADRNKDGRIDPHEAKDFFPQFGLPNQFLSNVSE